MTITPVRQTAIRSVTLLETRAQAQKTDGRPHTDWQTLNPQPLPPRESAVALPHPDWQMLNPQPLPPRIASIDGPRPDWRAKLPLLRPNPDWQLLNPQPLPPRHWGDPAPLLLRAKIR